MTFTMCVNLCDLFGLVPNCLIYNERLIGIQELLKTAVVLLNLHYKHILILHCCCIKNNAPQCCFTDSCGGATVSVFRINTKTRAKHDSLNNDYTERYCMTLFIRENNPLETRPL